MGTLASRNSPRISLTRNITSAHTLEELKTQIGEFVNKLEDYLNSQIGIHFLQDNRRRPTLIAGDLVFDFTNHPEFATLQQWDGEKLIPLDLSAISGYIDLVAQGIGSGTDSSLFLRSDGAGHWVLAAGPVGPPGADGLPGADGIDGTNGADGSVWYNGAGVPAGGLGIDGDYYIRTSNGDVYFKAAGLWSIILNIVGPAGAAGAAGGTGATGATGATGSPGPGVLVGAGAPSNSLGVDGQIYINTLNGDLLDKESGVWVLYGSNAYRIQGKIISGTSETTSPADGDRLTFDYAADRWKAIAGGGSSQTYASTLTYPSFL